MTLDVLVRACSIGPSVVGGLEFCPPTTSDELSSKALSVRESSSGSAIVVVVDTDDSSVTNGPLRDKVDKGDIKPGVVVVVISSLMQLVFFLN